MVPLADLSPELIALAAALLGGGGVAALFRLGPDRTSVVVAYQLKMIEGLQTANSYLAKENGLLRQRVEDLEARVHGLELDKDHPPPHLS